MQSFLPEIYLYHEQGAKRGSGKDFKSPFFSPNIYKYFFETGSAMSPRVALKSRSSWLSLQSSWHDRHVPPYPASLHVFYYEHFWTQRKVRSLQRTLYLPLDPPMTLYYLFLLYSIFPPIAYSLHPPIHLVQCISKGEEPCISLLNLQHEE